MFKYLIEKLIEAGVDSPRLEARLIMTHILKIDYNQSFDEHIFSNEQKKKVESFISRRLSHEPLDKILGYKGFYKHSFIVSKDVLSPRPDSEVLVEQAIDIAKSNNFTTILELGVGSGCLLLSIITDVSVLKATGADKSMAALNIAKKNAKELGVSKRVSFIEYDYFTDALDDKFDMIITNPPYIPSSDILELSQEVQKYDPYMALDGGKDGYDHYKQIASIVPSMLNSGGYVLVEAGIGQASKIKKIFENNGLCYIRGCDDLGGIERCIIFKK